MYNERYIDMFINHNNENVLYRLLDNYKKLDINDLSLNNQRLYFAFQHFIIKCYLDGYRKDVCVKYMQDMYLDFNAKPYLFCDSPLIKDELLDTIVPEHIRVKIKALRDRYYSKDALSLASKDNLSEEEKCVFYANLISMLKSDNKDKDLLDNEAKKIISKDVKSLSEMELKFLGYYVSVYARGIYSFDTSVLVCSEDNITTMGNQKNDCICLNKNNIPDIPSLVEVICHETRHSIQEHDSVIEKNKTALKQAQFALFDKYLRTETFNQYKQNYRYTAIELDAECFGYHTASVFFKTMGRDDIADIIKDKRKEHFDKRDYYAFMVTEGEENKLGHMQMDEYAVKMMNDIIKNHPEELENYPVLQELYKKDGTVKSFLSLMAKRMDHNRPDKDIFEEYIDYSIVSGKINEFPLENTSKDFVNDYASALSTIFNGYAIKLNDYLEDDFTSGKHSTNENQIVYVMEDLITRCHNIMEYFLNNYRVFFAYSEDKSFTARINNPLFNIIVGLRDLDISKIQNPVIKNHPGLIGKLSYLKKEIDSYIKIYNNAYVDSMLSNLPEEVLKSDIETPLGVVNFEHYFKDILSRQMDNHTKVMVGGNTYYIGDLIYEYSKKLSSKTRGV